MLRKLSKIGVIATVLCFALAGWLGWDSITHSSDPATNATGPTSTDHPGTNAEGYSALKIFRSASVRFAGKVTLRNQTRYDVQVLVTVNMYDGEQNVGHVFGHTTLRPHSASRVDLTGFDHYTRFTESRVSLSRLPS
jgi:hypothetical protein